MGCCFQGHGHRAHISKYDCFNTIEQLKQMKILTILLHAKYFACKCRLYKFKATPEAIVNNLKSFHEVDKHVHLLEITVTSLLRNGYIISR